MSASAAKVVDYFLSPSSPWTYLGHARFASIASAAGASVNAKPVDFGVIFPQSGGLPLPKRAPQRQAYRLLELARWNAYLGIPLVVQPKHFPVDSTVAAHLICGAPEDKRMALAGELLAALWSEDRNIADMTVLSAAGERHGVFDATSAIAAGKAVFEANTASAVAQGVFGAPSYVYRGEIFWGQDRLEFLQRALAAG